MSKEVDKANVLRVTKVRTKLRGDGSWLQRKDEAQEETEEEKPWLAEVRANRINGAPVETSPVSSPTKPTPTPDKPVTERAPTSGYLIRGVFTKTDKPASPTSSTSNGLSKPTTQFIKKPSDSYKKIAPYTVKPATENKEDQLNQEELEKRTEAASSVLRTSAARQRSYVLSAAKKFEAPGGSPTTSLVNETPSFVARRVNVTEDDAAPAGPKPQITLPVASVPSTPEPTTQKINDIDVKKTAVDVAVSEPSAPKVDEEKVAAPEPVKEDPAPVSVAVKDPFEGMKPGCTKVDTPLPELILNSVQEAKPVPGQVEPPLVELAPSVPMSPTPAVPATVTSAVAEKPAPKSPTVAPTVPKSPVPISPMLAATVPESPTLISPTLPSSFPDPHSPVSPILAPAIPTKSPTPLSPTLTSTVPEKPALMSPTVTAIVPQSPAPLSPTLTSKFEKPALMSPTVTATVPQSPAPLSPPVASTVPKSPAAASPTLAPTVPQSPAPLSPTLTSKFEKPALMSPTVTATVPQSSAPLSPPVASTVSKSPAAASPTLAPTFPDFPAPMSPTLAATVPEKIAPMSPSEASAFLESLDPLSPTSASPVLISPEPVSAVTEITVKTQPEQEPEPSPKPSSGVDTLAALSDTLISFDTSSTSSKDNEPSEEEGSVDSPSTQDGFEQEPAPELSNCLVMTDDLLALTDGPEESAVPVPTSPGRWSQDLLGGLDSEANPVKTSDTLDLLANDAIGINTQTRSSSTETVTTRTTKTVTITDRSEEDNAEQKSSRVTTTVTKSSSADPFDPYAIESTSPNSASDLLEPFSDNSINSSSTTSVENKYRSPETNTSTSTSVDYKYRSPETNTSSTSVEYKYRSPESNTSTSTSVEYKYRSPEPITRSKASESLADNVDPIDTDSASLHSTRRSYARSWETDPTQMTYGTGVSVDPEDAPAEDQNTMVMFERKSKENDSPWDRWTSPTVYTVPGEEDDEEEEEEDSLEDTQTAVTTTTTIRETHRKTELSTHRYDTTYSSTVIEEDRRVKTPEPEKKVVYVKEYVNSTEMSSQNARDTTDGGSDYFTSSSANYSYSSPSSVPMSSTCTFCEKPVGNDAKITIEHLGINSHPDCFKCGVCNKPMGDLLYSMFLHGGKVHCETCYRLV